MLACVDTHYTNHGSRTALVLFENWQDEMAMRDVVDENPQTPGDYVPGEFFRRELPCILSVARPLVVELETIVVDGYVWLDGQGRQGLGALLYEALDASVRVIGVAKSPFRGSTGIDVFRGASRKPLVVTAAGLDATEAARLVQSMHGAHRIPTLLKRADSLSRHGMDGVD